MPASVPSAIRVTAEHVRLLQELTETLGVSGGEEPVRRIIRREIAETVDEIWTDALGNLLAVRRGRRRNRLKVMLAAHMDEVGFMVTDVASDGFLAFRPVGNVAQDQIPGKSVWLGDARLLGVIGTTPIHLTDEGTRSASMPIQSLRIDIGAGSRQAALARVQPGDRASYATHLRREAGLLFAKALDDRLGVATLIELLRLPHDGVDLMAAFTVQEEISHNGARVAAQALGPDLAVILEATPARDLPVHDGSENRAYNSRLGEGPVIYAADRRTVSDPRLFSTFVEAAERLGRPYQIRQPGGGSTDAAAIHLVHGGIPSISVSVPVRNMHGPIGIVRIADWRACVALVHQVLAGLRPATMRRH